MENYIDVVYKLRNVGKVSFDFHSHNEYEIYLFHSGDCKYLIHNQIYDLHPGDLILMDGLTLHRANPSPVKPYERSVVHFAPYWIKPVIDALGIPDLLMPLEKFNNCLVRVSNVNELRKIELLIEAIAKKSSYLKKDDKNAIVEAEAKVLLIELLLQIYTLSKQGNPTIEINKTEKDEYVEKIVIWIEQHYTRKITLDEIANSLNLNKYYLSHLFKEVTGSTVMEYLMTCRLNKIRYYLEKHPEKTASEIAKATGFESIAHFSRFFRKKMGVTPTLYRKLHAK